jgi:V8-like Glu-specific endopeptidase
MNARATFAALALGAGLALVGAPTASASAMITPGDTITLDNSRACTVGFIASNARKDRLAVTAGHCSKHSGEVVTAGGHRIGKVVAHASDPASARGPFGVTLIKLDEGVHTNARFTKVGSAKVGDTVGQSGQFGTVTSSNSQVFRATTPGEPGNSGGPVVNTRTGTLYGLLIGGSPTRGTYSVPVRTLVSHVQSMFPKWGAGFRVVGTSTKQEVAA